MKPYKIDFTFYTGLEDIAHRYTEIFDLEDGTEECAKAAIEKWVFDRWCNDEFPPVWAAPEYHHSVEIHEMLPGHYKTVVIKRLYSPRDRTVTRFAYDDEERENAPLIKTRGGE